MSVHLPGLLPTSNLNKKHTTAESRCQSTENKPDIATIIASTPVEAPKHLTHTKHNILNAGILPSTVTLRYLATSRGELKKGLGRPPVGSLLQSKEMDSEHLPHAQDRNVCVRGARHSRRGLDIIHCVSSCSNCTSSKSSCPMNGRTVLYR